MGRDIAFEKSLPLRRKPAFCKQGEEPKPLDQPSRFLSIPSSGKLGGTLMRYSHWDKILDGMGLSDYKGRLRPPGKDHSHYYNGMTFQTGITALLKLIKTDLGKSAEGLSDVALLKKAGASI